MRKISVSLSGHQTSISLEEEFINALKEIAANRNKSIASIISAIDSNRPQKMNLSSAIRVWVLSNLKN